MKSPAIPFKWYSYYLIMAVAWVIRGVINIIVDYLSTEIFGRLAGIFQN
ncbi:MAG: hypothetical protein LBH67_03450 [Rickettsia sp.]|jgi:hypothetical protein|nr:hypothetical protein [Rickettsia sp.]